MPFQDAYERILQSTGLRTQTDVAAMLGVKQSSISDAKRRPMSSKFLADSFAAFSTGKRSFIL